MSAVRLRRSDLAAASILTVLLLVAAAPCPAAAPAPALSRNGMVVTSQPDATRAGVAMLEAGGNAVDAAVAAAFAVGVTQPFSAGLGGGGFILIHRPGGQVVAVDARETAPAAADRDMYVRDGVRDDASMVGGLAVATPGWVAGLALALERYGTLSLAAVVAPASEITSIEQTVLTSPLRRMVILGRAGSLVLTSNHSSTKPSLFCVFSLNGMTPASPGLSDRV